MRPARLLALALGLWLGPSPWPLAWPCSGSRALADEGAHDLGVRAAPTPQGAPLAAPREVPRREAGEVAGEATRSARPALATAGLFAAGAATAFVAHEGCHVAANLALGNVPRLEPVRFGGFLPFFTVDHRITCAGDRCFRHDGSSFGPGRPGLFVILSAGFHCQHVGDELILSTEPDLRAAGAPFRTGMLAFNTLASVAYVAADWGGFEPEQGDLAGLRRDARAPRHVFNGLLLGVALLDAARFVWPDVPWLAWTSRSLKVGAGGVILAL
jgi:hypothetical protein